MVRIVAKRYSRSRRLAKTIWTLVRHLDPATRTRVPAARNATTGSFRRFGTFRQPHGDLICFRMSGDADFSPIFDGSVLDSGEKICKHRNPRAGQETKWLQSTSAQHGTLRKQKRHWAPITHGV